MIDSHVHLDAAQYADVDQVIKRAIAAGVEAVVAPGIGPSSNARLTQLVRDYPGFVYRAIGFHPENSELADSDFAATVAELRTNRDAICALGEVGLPWYSEGASEPAIQEQARVTLFRFAQIAVELDLAMILHAPHDAAAAALEIIRTVGVRRAVFHWHKSDAATTAAIVRAGYYISITPEVAYRERDKELARVIPLNRMLVETDGPWPYQAPFAGRPTEPAMVAEAITAIAAVRGESVAAVRDATVANARALFRI
jgi:TatD DNase family protein